MSASTVDPVVAGPSLVNTLLGMRAAEYATVCFEHVLCDTTDLPNAWVSSLVALEPPSVPSERHFVQVAAEQACNGAGPPLRAGELPLSLETLGAVRTDARASAANLRLDSAAVAAREILALPAGALVCDVTTVDEGRDVSELARAAELLARSPGSVALCFGASVGRADLRAALAWDRPAAAIEAALSRELLRGCAVAADVRRLLPPGSQAPAAAFITAAPLFDAPGGELSAEDAALLGGARLSSAKTGALVVATLPAAPSADVLAARARSVLRLLDGARHVALRCATKLPQTLAAAAEPHFCIVDGFGRPDEPSLRREAGDDDAAIFDWLEQGAPRGRICVSVGVRHKAQLRAYGGLGYDHAAKCLGTRGADAALLGVRLLPGLAWASRPPPVKAGEVRLFCSLCAETFTVKKGHHFSKFDNVYCTRSCLNAHREKNYTAEILKGPTASDQGA